MPPAPPHIVVIGAGIGGLCCALQLVHAGAQVTIVDSHAQVGGKMRTLPTVAGPVDAGPTVLTMKHVFDTLFTSVGARLADHVTLTPEPILARHFWSDGTQLDLMQDTDQSRDNIMAAFGTDAARDFTKFMRRSAALYAAFDAPMMQTPVPTLAAMTAQTLRNPRLIPAMAPHQSLARSLRSQFRDPRLAQLFARYATYVGGIPEKSPAILSLIAHAEASGVWHVKGGMHRLATAIADLAVTKGAQLCLATHATRIETQNGRTAAVQTDVGRIKADAVVFNGDPQAIHTGLLGTGVAAAVPDQSPRSLSACVHSFAAIPAGPTLAGHNVIFADDPATEYAPLTRGQPQTDPTLYICAQDRFGGNTPTGPERFEIIMNAPPLTAPEDKTCQTLIFNRLRDRGLTFSPTPDANSLTTPTQFAAMFPASTGSLYGRSPHTMTAAFKRPTARTSITGLYLAGGGTHPGAGVPMAALSGRHAAAAMISDLCLTSMSPQADMHGGMSTA